MIQPAPYNHAICPDCWSGRFPNLAAPVSLTPCCSCGSSTYTGLWIASDPLTMPCGGNHSNIHDRCLSGIEPTPPTHSCASNALSGRATPVSVPNPLDKTAWENRMKNRATRRFR